MHEDRRPRISRSGRHPNERPSQKHRVNPPVDEMHAYDTKDLERLFGLPASAVRALARSGNIHPVRRAGRLHYSFQDLLVLGTASALRAGSDLNRLSVAALVNLMAIREGQTLREPETGQYALALEIVEAEFRLHVIARQDAAEYEASADELYMKALALEEIDPQGARAVYESCLEAHPAHVDARINLGRLLHLAGRLREAEHIYRSGDQREPFLVFNLAVLLEDLDREPDAITAYREALALDPQFADAHFNLARLYERARDPKASLRHLLAYRRMIDGQGA